MTKTKIKKQFRQHLKRVAQNLRECRAQTDYSQSDLGRRIRIHRTYISLMERMASNPSLRLLTLTSAAFGLKTRQLLLARPPRIKKVQKKISRADLKSAYARQREALARNLKRNRLRRGLSQIELGAKSRIHPTYISLVERELTNPSLLTLCQIAATLRVPVEGLLAG